MAGEVTKTVRLTNIQSNLNELSRDIQGNQKAWRAQHAYATTELELLDVLITEIELPSNTIVNEVLVMNDDLDSGTPALIIDIGLAAGAKFESITGGTKTIHAEDDVLDADVFVDGSAVLQAATLQFTSLDLDTGTAGPDNIYKPVWELLGYDKDPHTFFRLMVTIIVIPATAVAGDVVFLVKGTVD